MSKIERAALVLLAIDLLALTLLGNTYSKHILYWFNSDSGVGLYLHDIIIFLVAGLCLIGHNFYRSRIYVIEGIIALSVIYLCYSIIQTPTPYFSEYNYVVIRQYSIFGYMGLAYLISKKLYSEQNLRVIIKGLFFFGLLCVFVQTCHLISISYKGQLLSTHKHSYSPIIIMGLIVFNSYTLILLKRNIAVKMLLSFFFFLLAISTGHESSYLALFIIWISYMFVKSNSKIKISTIILSAVALFIIFGYFPPFLDVNASWRLLFWESAIQRIIENYGIFGEGFGIQYANESTSNELNQHMLDYGYNIEILGLEKYIVAPHNSFLTIFLHIGFMPSFLFIGFFVNRVIKINFSTDLDSLFLLLIIFGMSIYAFFNMVLELPISSMLFWLVMFFLIFHINTKSRHALPEL